MCPFRAAEAGAFLHCCLGRNPMCRLYLQRTHEPTNQHRLVYYCVNHIQLNINAQGSKCLYSVGTIVTPNIHNRLSVVYLWELCGVVPSRRIPTLRHFWKRQNGHLFLWVLSILHSWFSAHVYLLLFCTVRLKKPWNETLCVESRRLREDRLLLIIRMILWCIRWKGRCAFFFFLDCILFMKW